MTPEEMDKRIEQSTPMKATRAAMSAVDYILADIKDRGAGMQYQTKQSREVMRQKWISETVARIMGEFSEVKDV